jgi:Conserved TM helix
MLLAKVNYEQGVSDAFARVAKFVPELLFFLVILIVGILIAKTVQKIITKVLQRVGFDELVERGGVKKALSKSKYDAATILARIAYYFIFLLVLSAAFSAFGPNPVSDFLAKIIAFLPNVFVAVLVIVIASAVAAAVKELLSNMLGGLSYGSALANVVSLFIVGIGVFFALDQLNIAPLIVGGIFYALLALIVIPPIIAFGVGGIDPARDAIRTLTNKASDKAGEIKQEARSSSSDDAPTAPTPVAGRAVATPVTGRAASTPTAAPAKRAPRRSRTLPS